MTSSSASCRRYVSGTPTTTPATETRHACSIKMYVRKTQIAQTTVKWMVGQLAGHACDRRVRMKSAGATPVARHCLPLLSGLRRRAARGPMPSPTLFERIPPAARDIARWPFFLRPTSGSAGYPLADVSGKTGGSSADCQCMLSGM